MTILKFIMVTLLSGAFLLFWKLGLETHDYRYGVRAFLCFALAAVLCFATSRRGFNRKK